MDGKTCGKVFLIGCIIIIVLGLLTVGGCVYCGYNMFGGLISTAMNTVKLQTYFQGLESDGWEVDDSESGQAASSGAEVELGDTMIWRARENEDDDWIYYVWEAGRADPDKIQDEFQEIFNIMLIPRTQAAMDVHNELKLPLPDNFELDEWTPRDSFGKDTDDASGQDSTGDQDADSDGDTKSRDRDRPAKPPRDSS